jgi:hypothetical protein
LERKKKSGAPGEIRTPDLLSGGCPISLGQREIKQLQSL